jgi:hypothetical protein
MSETGFELNIGIDLFWKVWATVLGYCNSAYTPRKSETFSRLYNTFFEDFLAPVVKDWKWPMENAALKILLQEYNSDVSMRWIDTCLESAYLVSNSSTFRPPRPLTIGEEKIPQSNYFIELPDYIQNRFKVVNMYDLSRSCPFAIEID